MLREGSDVTVVCYGTMVNNALECARILQTHGVSAEVIKLGIIKPNGLETTLASLKKTGRLIIPEESCAPGCMGERILALCAQQGIELRAARLINLGDGIVPQGSVAELWRDYGLDAQSIADAAMQLCRAECGAQ